LVLTNARKKIQIFGRKVGSYKKESLTAFGLKSKNMPFYNDLCYKITMCLIILAYDAHPLYRLVLAANRDEFFARPTAPAVFWDDDPRILAGRDLKDGGTWLGITRGGRIAALTNYRDPNSERKSAPSRGNLVKSFLQDKRSIEEYLEILKREGPAYNGFNLIFGDTERFSWFSNRHELPGFLERGVHGLSNHILDTPWPKVSGGKESLMRIIRENNEIDPEQLLTILANRTVPPDDSLPKTGVGIKLERILSPVFISSRDYGTRSSTVILVDREGFVTFVERTFNGNPAEPKDKEWRFMIG